MSELKNVPNLSVLGQDNSNLFHANEQADTQTALPADFGNRAERFRESWEMIRTLTNPKTHNFPYFEGKHYGSLTGNIDVVPKVKSRLPMVAVGRARQELDWLANTADGWIWHGVNPKDTKNIVQTLVELNQDGAWHPFGYANFVELSDNPNEPAACSTTSTYAVVQMACSNTGKSKKSKAWHTLP